MADTSATSESLSAPLELREGQGGFAGTSGQVWRIGTDGTYSVARFLNKDEQPPHARGQLRPGQLAALAAALRESQLASLPPNLGIGSIVNPRTTELRYGAQRIVMSQAPGDVAASASASASTGTGTGIDAAAQARFARLVARLKAELPPEAR